MFTGTLEFFPLVFCTISGELTLPDIEEQRVFYRSMHGRNQRLAIFTDARGTGRPDAVVRAKIAELVDAFAPDSGRNTVVSSVIHESKLAVGALTAVSWLLQRRDPVTYQYSLTLQEALEKSSPLLGAEGIIIGAPARTHAQDADRKARHISA